VHGHNTVNFHEGRGSISPDSHRVMLTQCACGFTVGLRALPGEAFAQALPITTAIKDAGKNHLGGPVPAAAGINVARSPVTKTVTT